MLNTLSRKWLAALVLVLAVAGVLGTGSVVVSGIRGAQAQTYPPAAEADLPRREVNGQDQTTNGKAPNISFINSPSPTCILPEPGTAVCYIEWSYLYVSASSGQNVISMTVSIDDHLRAYHAGFFQSAMYIPGSMTAPGYQVTCGGPGSSGNDEWGQTYSYVIRARETGGLSAANYGAVTCPPDLAQVFLPIVQ